MTATILPDVVAEAERLLEAAERHGAALAPRGGVAVRLHAPEVPAVLDRQYKDIDFAVPKGGSGAADKILRESGYEPEITFNAMMGKERMLFHDPEHGRQVDVFVGSF